MSSLETWNCSAKAITSEGLINLYEKINGMLELFDGDGEIGEIGEATLPLYFEDETLACNFILTGYSSTSFWRCIYVCQCLEEK